MGLKEELQIYRPEDFPEWILIESIAFLEISYLIWAESDYMGLEEMLIPDSLNEDVLPKNIASLLRCMRSPDMRYEWSQFGEPRPYSDDPSQWRQIGEPLPCSAELSQCWFAHALSTSNPNDSSVYMTKGEANKWKNELRGALTKALGLLDNCPYNLPFISGRNYETEEYRDPKKDIEKVINSLDQAEYKRGYFGGSVHGDYAERTFFIRSLSTAFIQTTGKPCENIVAASASAAFKCTLTEAEVVRATKDLDLTIEHNVHEMDAVEFLEGFRCFADELLNGLRESVGWPI